MAAFLKGAVAYKKKIGFTGTLLLEPKPQVLLGNIQSSSMSHQTQMPKKRATDSRCDGGSWQ